MLGLYNSLALLVFTDDTVPEVAVANTGYKLVEVAVSLLTVTEVPAVAQVNAVPFHCKDVPAVVGAVIKLDAPAPVL